MRDVAQGKSDVTLLCTTKPANVLHEDPSANNNHPTKTGAKFLALTNEDVVAANRNAIPLDLACYWSLRIFSYQYTPPTFST
jgi:hypothetical protein